MSRLSEQGQSIVVRLSVSDLQKEVIATGFTRKVSSIIRVESGVRRGDFIGNVMYVQLGGHQGFRV